MSFDSPRAFEDAIDPSLIPLDRSDRSALAKLLTLVLDADAPTTEGQSEDWGRAEFAKWLYDQRRLREQYLPPELLGEPAWDILLLLYWARHQQRRLSVTAVCASAGAATTTALRYIDHLHRSNMLEKEPHPTDRRISWLSLSDEMDAKIARYLDHIRNAPAPQASGLVGDQAESPRISPRP